MLHGLKILKSRAILGFWNQLFFWTTIILTLRHWMDTRSLENKNKVRVTINGKEYNAKHITIKEGYIFLDGKCICPTNIDEINIR